MRKAQQFYQMPAIIVYSKLVALPSIRVATGNRKRPCNYFSYSITRPSITARRSASPQASDTDSSRYIYYYTYMSMLQLHALGDHLFHNDRKHSNSALSVAKSSSTDTNSSKKDHNSSIIDANQEPSSRSHYPRSFTGKPTSVKLHSSTNKEKSQLCRKYIDTGSCPYGLRCKFAHGAHELRQNQQVNSRYKTKECGTFFREGYCRFGNRCNFLHTKPTNDDLKKETLTKIMGNHRECIQEMREQSRLLKLLSLDQQ